MAQQAVGVLTAAEAAVDAGLRYVSDAQPGIRRRRKGDTFEYLDASGKRVRDPGVLQRIKLLAVPPAWEDVWISPTANGHIQATGRDQRGRKQYRYHPRWREVRDEAKYGRLIAFGEALPRIRERVTRDLERPGLPREKVLATVVRLLELTDIRVGNDEYAVKNRSYGLTTLRDKHVSVNGPSVSFKFTGKGGKRHSIDVRDRALVRIVRRCRDLPGYELFQYVDADGVQQTIDAADVNAYLREVAGAEFTAKDFRTWDGTLVTARALRELGPATSQAQAKRNVNRAVEEAAGCLGNTVAVCRKAYVHPAVIDGYLEGRLVEAVGAGERERGLSADESALLAFLRQEAGR